MNQEMGPNGSLLLQAGDYLLKKGYVLASTDTLMPLLMPVPAPMVVFKKNQKRELIGKISCLRGKRHLKFTLFGEALLGELGDLMSEMSRMCDCEVQINIDLKLAQKS